MRVDHALLVAFVYAAQPGPGDGPQQCGLHVDPIVSFKFWNSSGSMRLVAWDRDSIAIFGRAPSSRRVFCAGGGAGVKLGIEEGNARADLVAYVPRRATVSLRTVDGDITGTDVSGWFYTVGGSIRLSGNATSIEAESLNGNIDVNVTTPWVKARTGRGHLLLRGAPQDAEASTIGGTLSIASAAILRGQFSSVTGDIHYAAEPAGAAIVEFSTHSGGVDLLMPARTSASLTLSSVSGPIENGFSSLRPTAANPRSLKIRLGSGAAQMTVRTFKGVIRLRPGADQ